MRLGGSLLDFYCFWLNAAFFADKVLWWRLAYFKMQDTVDGQVKRYSSNFEGNGYRYLVQSLLREIKMKDKLDIQGLSGIEGITVAKILGDIRQ